VSEAMDALRRIVGADAAARVSFARDADIERIVLSWPVAFATERADTLGFARDSGIEAIIASHLESA
jgi:D-erythronate 2-dehydrogenase